MNRSENPLPMQLKEDCFLGDVCPNAETLFLQALQDDGEGLITVNNIIAVKFNGRLLGLGLENAPCTDGKLESGKWYYPADKNVRNRIRAAYIDGERNINFSEITDWRKYRFADASYDGVRAKDISKEELVFIAKTEVGRLQNKQRGTTREYRVRHMDTQKDPLDRLVETTAFLTSVRTT